MSQPTPTYNAWRSTFRHCTERTLRSFVKDNNDNGPRTEFEVKFAKAMTQARIPRDRVGASEILDKFLHRRDLRLTRDKRAQVHIALAMSSTTRTYDARTARCLYEEIEKTRDIRTVNDQEGEDYISWANIVLAEALEDKGERKEADEIYARFGERAYAFFIAQGVLIDPCLGWASFTTTFRRRKY